MIILYILWSVLYSVFSFSLTDPNLVLFQATWYQNFQQYMWEVFFKNPVVLTTAYLALIVAGFAIYVAIYRRFHSKDSLALAERVEEYALYRTTHFSLKYIFSRMYSKAFIFFILLVVPLTFSYNALSHDVFNYMFNAKMVVEYKVNPHEQVALDFPQEKWIRFMHNTHTPAPYGYGWTALSIVPYMVGIGKFFLTWLSFRVFSIASMLALYIALQYFSVEMRRKYLSLPELFLVFCNPLVLIEVVSNSHNDLWMMAPAVASFGLLFAILRKKYVPSQLLATSAALLFFSITIKFATVVLLVPWLLLLVLHALKLFSLEKITQRVSYPFMLSALNFGSNLVLEKVFALIPFVASVLLFLPLLTVRSQQFHPWYLLWVFVWIPFIKNKIWKFVLLVLSVSSLLRYSPWMYSGGFEGSVLLHQKMITWLTVMVALVGYYAVFYKKKPYWWK